MDKGYLTIKFIKGFHDIFWGWETNRLGERDIWGIETGLINLGNI